MNARFEELDFRPTPMGELVLRRRWDLTFDREVYEIKLDDDFLMSSLFTVAEEEMGRLALAELTGSGLDVVVGGLGLGYTAKTVLESAEVNSLTVIDALGEVIEWHRSGLIPSGAPLLSDPRCTLVHGDFFAMVQSDSGLDPTSPGRRFHAIVVDIDHSPSHWLNPGHAAFYEPAGLRHLAASLHPGGVFALWSNDPPDDTFTAALTESFTDVRAQVVSFDNPLQNRKATNTVYLAKARSVA
ncbi:MAG: Spermidine synthase [Amycolatopsis sp.]|jgi:spermidine synthase|uniref:spermidine synthase n=1 Tax=Amycolatopsis sp. TaxID=37632 RepID=UPI00261046FB|nr:spermidine synthase [Amycolatopsis sp.]MCU1681971.1 Spermidine synthase [Amycolatopsis sp.]